MSDCKHEGELLISQLMNIPRLGVTSLVECADCDMVVGNCHWEQVKPLEFKLIFSPPELDRPAKKSGG